MVWEKLTIQCKNASDKFLQNLEIVVRLLPIKCEYEEIILLDHSHDKKEEKSEY